MRPEHRAIGWGIGRVFLNPPVWSQPAIWRVRDGAPDLA